MEDLLLIRNPKKETFPITQPLALLLFFFSTLSSQQQHHPKRKARFHQRYLLLESVWVIQREKNTQAHDFHPTFSGCGFAQLLLLHGFFPLYS